VHHHLKPIPKISLKKVRKHETSAVEVKATAERASFVLSVSEKLTLKLAYFCHFQNLLITWDRCYGNKFILTIMDRYLRFIAAVPCKAATAEEAAKGLFHGWI
jgi:hypothetical protein